MYEKSLKYNILFRLRQIFIHSASKMGMPFLPYLSYWHIKNHPLCCIILIINILQRFLIEELASDINLLIGLLAIGSQEYSS